MIDLTEELGRLDETLRKSEAESEDRGEQIISLGKRLNRALASAAGDLAKYRSEFFGRLRDVLGAHEDFEISGDRFVFQSEVLFPSASAELNEDGRASIAKLAQTLLDVSPAIPSELNWVLRIDGHTDREPIATRRFPSNWELSAARAIAVVNELHNKGIPEHRLVAAGFGEHHPLDEDETEDAYRRNRRIEFQLTQR